MFTCEEDSISKLCDAFLQESNVEEKLSILQSVKEWKEEYIYEFIKETIYTSKPMEVVYQLFRICLYHSSNKRFQGMITTILTHFDNEMLYRMKAFHDHRMERKRGAAGTKISLVPTLLCGNNAKTLIRVPDQSIQLIFSSPPYYNARSYSNYTSYQKYLECMKSTLKECHRVLEDGRFIIINVSPVIEKRPSREYESIRYPIHFDFHRILTECGFYFIDEILWIKPEYSVPNRIGGYHQSRKPLSYKPNCITESILVYRKNVPFLLDENIRKDAKGIVLDRNESYDTTNCWYIQPKHSKKHPAIFPEELCRKILTYYSYPKDTVLDMFAGTGTFGKVAWEMDRIPILCEQNQEYIQMILENGIYTK